MKALIQWILIALFVSLAFFILIPSYQVLSRVVLQKLLLGYNPAFFIIMRPTHY